VVDDVSRNGVFDRRGHGGRDPNEWEGAIVMKAGAFPVAGTVVIVEGKETRSPEWGRKAILAGWLIAMAGIAGYVNTMVHAPQDAGLFEALAWLSAALVSVGVWVAGNLAILRGIAD
jgi:hypothetical protein